jgi:hypothetical protein
MAIVETATVHPPIRDKERADTTLVEKTGDSRETQECKVGSAERDWRSGTVDADRSESRAG